MTRDEYHWKLFDRACEILDERANGHALPILRKLARRRFAYAMERLIDYVGDAEAMALTRAAARTGDPTAAYNLAIEYRNRGDMAGYRHALGRAARIDREAASERRRFLTRFPHEIMRKHGRLARDRG